MARPRDLTEDELLAWSADLAEREEALAAEQARFEQHVQAVVRGKAHALGAGIRRRFTGEATADPDRPGFALVYLDDGSAVAVRDEREITAGSRTAGQA